MTKYWGWEGEGAELFPIPSPCNLPSLTLVPTPVHTDHLNNICCDGCSERSESASPYTAARNLCILATSYQWRSQNRIVARAQVGHIYNAAQHAKVSVQKHTLLGGSGGIPPPPGKFWNLGPPRSHLLGFQAE